MRHCSSGKVCFETEYQAEEALVHSLAARGDAPGNPNGFYLCGICSCFHLTSKTRNPDLLKDPAFQARVARERQNLDWG